jgi:DUF1680 family protein
VRRSWKAGDRVRLTFDDSVQIIAANPLLRENGGRVAVQRGPLVYCGEDLDQDGTSILQSALQLDPTAPGGNVRVEKRPDLLGGVTVLKIPGTAWEAALADEPLYSPWQSLMSRPKKPVEVTLVPFYTFANREPSAMAVWLPYQASGAAAAVSKKAVATQQPGLH